MQSKEWDLVRKKKSYNLDESEENIINVIDWKK